MQAIEKITNTNSWVTILIMLLFFSIVILKTLDAERFKKIVFSLFDINFTKNNFEEKSSAIDAFKIVKFLFSITVLSLLVNSFKAYKLLQESTNFGSFTMVFLTLLAYFLLKRSLEYVISSLFLIKNEVNFFIISKTSYLFTITFLLSIAIVLIEYTSLKEVYIYYFAVFLFIIRVIVHFVSNKNLIFNKLFYFILYICAFEIAPLFLLFKLMF